MICPPVEAVASTAAAKCGPKAAALHERDRHRPVDHHVRHRAAGYRAEQARAHDRDLAGPAGGVAGEREREIHEELPGAALLHERAEEHEQHHVARGHAERRAEDAFGGEIELLHQHRAPSRW